MSQIIYRRSMAKNNLMDEFVMMCDNKAVVVFNIAGLYSLTVTEDVWHVNHYASSRFIDCTEAEFVEVLGKVTDKMEEITSFFQELKD